MPVLRASSTHIAIKDVGNAVRVSIDPSVEHDKVNIRHFMDNKNFFVGKL